MDLETILLHRDLPEKLNFKELMKALDGIRIIWKDDDKYSSAMDKVKEWLENNMTDRILKVIYSYGISHKLRGFDFRTFDEFKRYDTARNYWIDDFVSEKLKHKEFYVNEINWLL